MADEFYFADDYLTVELKGTRYHLTFRNIPVGKDPKGITILMCDARPHPRSALFSVRTFKGDDYIAVSLDVKSGDYVIEFGARPGDKEARSLITNLSREQGGTF
jgi:hypothetical protein